MLISLCISAADLLFFYARSKFSHDKANLQQFVSFDMSLVVRKPVFGFFDLVQHKPGCTAIEDG